MYVCMYVTISGCNEQLTTNYEDSTEISLNSSEPSIINNSLQFGSESEFNRFLHEINDISENELNSYMKSRFEAFESLRQKKEAISDQENLKDGDDEVLNLHIADPNFSSVLNENGVVQIGEYVFQITQKYTYLFKNREVFESFVLPKSSTNDKTNSIPCMHREINLINDDIYQIENCGTAIGVENPSPPNSGGSGGGNSDDDEQDDCVNHTNPEDLDLFANWDLDCSGSRTAEYESGGTTGRLVGKSWNQNFYVYSSLGTKTKHERQTWGKWWDRTADQISLESYVDYSYGEKSLTPIQLTASMSGTISQVLGIAGNIQPWIDVEIVVENALNLTIGEYLTEAFYDNIANREYQIIVKKIEIDKFDYDILPYDLQEHYPLHTKSNAKDIRKVFDWTTAIVSYPPGIEESALNFELHMMRSKHTLEHDGYIRAFITDKRE